MSYKDNRALSFLIVTAVYVISIAVGIITYNLLSFNYAVNLLIADIVSTVVVFIFSVIFNNASVYDPYWSVQPPVILICFAISYGLNLSGVIVLITVCIWAVRLTANWAYTFHSFNYEDWRYVMLKEKSKAFYPIVNFFGIHLVPTLVVYAVTMPAVSVIVSGAKFNPLALMFTALSLFAITIQGIADVQMHKFRKNKTGVFIKTGLWKYSRHPNYLGEILIWWGVGLYSFILIPSCPQFLIGAVLNTLLFAFISIPMAEKRQSRKEGFEEYKKLTRVLLPIKK